MPGPLKGHIPKNQFARPGVDLTRHGKSWQDIPITEVRTGDRVANVGVVTATVMLRGAKDVFGPQIATLYTNEGAFDFDIHATVSAFVATPGG